ncbi:MAG: solute-binding protein [Planctomycetales bacterium]|nr:solute-binding protein [Planctomycetales bacterium]
MLYPLLALWLVATGGCLPTAAQPPNASHASRRLRLATTTSVRDSGLLERLLPVFEKRHRCQVDVIAVGTGAALRLGAAGDADALLVHAPAAEEAFLAAGHASGRTPLMYNYFAILGPPHDPARIRGRPPVEALQRIAAGQFRFLSRGDDSGTHQRELVLWQQAEGRPPWDAYLASGQGMGATLVMADEMQAYVLTDQGTYLNFQDHIDLVPLTPPSEALKNTYSVLTVSAGKHPAIPADLARQLAQFLISPEAQQRIENYRVAGQQLFWPQRPALRPEK